MLLWFHGTFNFVVFYRINENWQQKKRRQLVADIHTYTQSHVRTHKQAIKFQPKHDSYYTNTQHFTPSVFYLWFRNGIFSPNVWQRNDKVYGNFFVLVTHPKFTYTTFLVSENRFVHNLIVDVFGCIVYCFIWIVLHISTVHVKFRGNQRFLHQYLMQETNENTTEICLMTHRPIGPPYSLPIKENRKFQNSLNYWFHFERNKWLTHRKQSNEIWEI